MHDAAICLDAAGLALVLLLVPELVSVVIALLVAGIILAAGVALLLNLAGGEYLENWDQPDDKQFESAAP